MREFWLGGMVAMAFVLWRDSQGLDRRVWAERWKNNPHGILLGVAACFVAWPVVLFWLGLVSRDQRLCGEWEDDEGDEPQGEESEGGS